MNYSLIVVLICFFFSNGTYLSKNHTKTVKNFFFAKVLHVLKNVLLLRPERRRDSSVG